MERIHLSASYHGLFVGARELLHLASHEHFVSDEASNRNCVIKNVFVCRILGFFALVYVEKLYLYVWKLLRAHTGTQCRLLVIDKGHGRD